MQLPSSKVVFTALAGVVTAAVVVLGHTGMPNGIEGWLRFAGEVLAILAAGSAAGYQKTENRPPASLVARIQQAN